MFQPGKANSGVEVYFLLLVSEKQEKAVFYIKNNY
jgi:hypothetical protein